MNRWNGANASILPEIREAMSGLRHSSRFSRADEMIE
jgi:hypothetical protein